MDKPQLTDAEFMSAQDKALVLKQWERFFKSGCQWDKFTDRLYKYLSLHCSFIAHYDRAGFWNCYFADGSEDTLQGFLDQFDRAKGETPLSCEYGCTYWCKDSDCADINQAMIDTATPYIPALRQWASTVKRDREIALATQILSGYGMSVTQAT